MAVKRVGIVGCGAMGSKIASVIAKDFKGKAVLSALYDIAPDKASQLARRLKKKGLVVPSLGALIKRVDFVIESAHPESSGRIALEAVRNRRDCMVMSVGGLLNAKRIFSLAKKNKARIYIPSGAICGIDGLKAHSLAGIERVVITTRKGPSSLKGAPYITKNKINLDKITKETLIFQGDALAAIKAFPQNINVAATLSLAGIGPKRTRVRIVCSPLYHGNTHEIEIISKAGRVFVRCENNPSPDNPKTSYLAILSAIAVLKGIFEVVKIGA